MFHMINKTEVHVCYNKARETISRSTFVRTRSDDNINARKYILKKNSSALQVGEQSTLVDRNKIRIREESCPCESPIQCLVWDETFIH